VPLFLPFYHFGGEHYTREKPRADARGIRIEMIAQFQLLGRRVYEDILNIMTIWNEKFGVFYNKTKRFRSSSAGTIFLRNASVPSCVKDQTATPT
jgi:hypothetical protein